MKIAFFTLCVLLALFILYYARRSFYRSQEASGEQISSDFLQFFVRMVSAGCFAGIGFMVLASDFFLQGRPPLFEILYWLITLGLALLLFLTGLADLLLVQRSYLVQKRELFRRLRREIKASNNGNQ